IEQQLNSYSIAVTNFIEMAVSQILTITIVVCTLLQTNLAYPLEVDVDEEPSYVYLYEEEPQMYHQRYVRSLQPGAPSFPMPGQQNQEGWKLDPSLTRDEYGNTRSTINVQHTGPKHAVEANWDKVIRGPARAKPTYSIRGSWKW
ncbi:hypothetical protein P7A73_14665, partial [Clostridium perfringens]|nr:hypothetical protein [Clostridium perfringens]